MFLYILAKMGVKASDVKSENLILYIPAIGSLAEI